MEKLVLRELIGRDRLIKGHIYPRIRKKLGFVLAGQRGIGKTEAERKLEAMLKY